MSFNSKMYRRKGSQKKKLERSILQKRDGVNRTVKGHSKLKLITRQKNSTVF